MVVLVLLAGQVRQVATEQQQRLQEHQPPMVVAAVVRTPVGPLVLFLAELVVAGQVLLAAPHLVAAPLLVLLGQRTQVVAVVV